MSSDAFVEELQLVLRHRQGRIYAGVGVKVGRGFLEVVNSVSLDEREELLVQFGKNLAVPQNKEFLFRDKGSSHKTEKSATRPLL